MTEKLKRALMALRLEAPGSVVDAMTKIIEEELEIARQDGFNEACEQYGHTG